MNATLQVRLATPDDARSIAAMSRDYIEQGLGWSWTTARVLRAIKGSDTNVVIAHDRTGLLAFGIMQYGDERAHLSLLAVQPVARRQGLGAQVLAWLEASALTAGIEAIRVEARADNNEALAFYRKQGFAPLSTVAGYYQGVIDAVRLEKKLGLVTPT